MKEYVRCESLFIAFYLYKGPETWKIPKLSPHTYFGPLGSLLDLKKSRASPPPYRLLESEKFRDRHRDLESPYILGKIPSSAPLCRFWAFLELGKIPRLALGFGKIPRSTPCIGSGTYGSIERSEIRVVVFALLVFSLYKGLGT